ncbi:MAG TPA: (Fe-S)-binding protein [Betaproteobacteria bacterium]|nr:(Fe-S)-binding protein [Betaproteobacteria bacterium]
MNSPSAGEATALLEEAGRCVACGLCLPFCPTYRKIGSEADSPRGRIAMIQGVLSGHFSPSARFWRHLDLCLGCRACENACPSRVTYGHLLDSVRASLAPDGRTTRELRWLVQKPWRLTWFGVVLRGWHAFGVGRLLQRIPGLRRRPLLQLAGTPLPAFAPLRWRKRYPAAGTPRGDVALFLGCVARVMDAATLNAAVYVLNRLGYTVHVPRGQACCGGLHRQDGDRDAAEALARQNIRAFSALRVSTLISVASGCGVTLTETFAAQEGMAVREISEFLTAAEGWPHIAIQPLPAVIRVHDPCSLANVTHGQDYPYRLLRRIPQARVEPLPGNGQCCGAAGSYFLRQPAMAAALLDDKMEAIRRKEAPYLATSNVGCALHLAQGVQAAGLHTAVMHPVMLLAQQMGYKNRDESRQAN